MTFHETRSRWVMSVSTFTRRDRDETHRKKICEIRPRWVLSLSELYAYSYSNQLKRADWLRLSLRLFKLRFSFQSNLSGHAITIFNKPATHPPHRPVKYILSNILAHYHYRYTLEQSMAEFRTRLKFGSPFLILQVGIFLLTNCHTAGNSPLNSRFGIINHFII